MTVGHLVSTLIVRFMPKGTCVVWRNGQTGPFGFVRWFNQAMQQG